MSTLTIDFDEEEYPQLKKFKKEEVSGFAKFAFNKWYNEEYNKNFNVDNLQTKIDQGLEPTINKLFGISKSTEKGKVYEFVLEQTISEHFKDCKYVDTAQTSHVGDGLLTLNNGAQCIVEAKNYTTTVPRAQIEKLKSDMRTTGINKAIMLATGTIQGKSFFDIETFNENHIIFISNYFDNPLLYLQLAITVIKHMTHTEVMSLDVLHRMATLNRTIELVTKLKSDYISMEKTIRSNLDAFYISLREYESNVKMQINNIIDNTTCENEDLIKRHSSTLLDRLYHEIVVPYGLTLSGTMDVDIVAKNVVLVNIKILKSSLNVTFVSPSSKINITSENFSVTSQMLKSMLKSHDQTTIVESEEETN